MNAGRRQIIFHFFGAILFLCLPYLTRPGKFSEYGFLSNSIEISEFITYLLILGFFYLNFYSLIPNLFFKRRYVYYFLLVLLCFLLISLLPDLLVPFDPMSNEGFRKDHPPPKGNFFIDKTGRHFFIFMAVFLFSLLLKISSRWRQTEKEKLQTEVSYLKAQINPHFLFNTLNSIYALAIEKSDDTATAVVKLSNMMRYVLHETAQDFVPLSHDLSYISDYIELQKLRFGTNIPLLFEIEGNAQGKQIAPMILMPFIENVFKHGINAEEDSFVSIAIQIKEDALQLLVTNNIVTVHTTETSSGVGIANTKKRLELLYPGKHLLRVQNKENKFSVQLNIEWT